MPPRDLPPRAITAAAVKDAICILDVAQGYGLKLSRSGREYVCLSPFKAERTPSCYIDPDKGLFKCFASGEGGDVIRFVQLMDGCGFMEALKKLAGEACLGDAEEERRRAERYLAQATSREQQRAEEKNRRIGTAWHIWHNRCEPAAGTLVETYLRWRGIDCDALWRVYGWTVPGALRFAPKLQTQSADGTPWDGPAMVGIMNVDLRGKRHFRGIHRTFLALNGAGKAPIPKAKKMLGSGICAETRLSPPGPVAVIGEGYETVLSVMGVLARDGEAVFGISALSLGNLAGGGHGIQPDPARPGLMLPEGVEELIILKDADGKKPEEIDILIRRAVTKFHRAGIARVRVASPELGLDFNDMVMGSAA